MVRTIELGEEAKVCDVLDTACNNLRQKYGELYVQTDGEMDMLYGTRFPTYYRVMHEHSLPQPVEVKRFLGLGRRKITKGRRELFYLDVQKSQIRVELDDEAIFQACESASRNPQEVRSSWSWDK